MSQKHQAATDYLRALEAYNAAKAAETAAYHKRNEADNALRAAQTAFARAASAGEGVIVEGKIVSHINDSGYTKVSVLALG